MRIAGTNIPDNKRLDIALTYIFGIGRTSAVKILGKAGVPLGKNPKDLKGEEINRLREELEKNYKVEGELRREVMFHIKRLRDIGSYRGSRHQRGLPSRGQRTKTNSRTRRGNVRKTMGSGKRKLEKK
ncbi:30S ribosomal protein S13 [Candidatus Giovannonibacteria bacterium RIFCSPLOWO2_01_FULL_46_13]|uniref:Small ribosomal subunit protein uS13 n=1 Tax=Candidatus Giovannonibacteria bacterium RIFCSPLOWO2_01_FULL_46_13 TaxID=1798352 RepID=A0A1F5X3K6_9BACT|nr:MAG: 30S ribosomal protein S13 [Candidatus Giovannonibacteria bacterium RIFCSPLOWO2_01_FULL_46_13]